jgi:RimJ/RimL family protein N-acetyltransferase
VTYFLALCRLGLSPVTRRDTGFLVAHWSDPEVRRFLFDASTASPDEITQTIDASANSFATVGYGLWVIRVLGETDPIGVVGLRPLDELGLEIIYNLTPAGRGNGYATEAAAGIIDYALGPLGLTEVFAEVDEGNVASAAVIERLGMTAFATVPGALGPMTRYRMAQRYHR